MQVLKLPVDAVFHLHMPVNLQESVEKRQRLEEGTIALKSEVGQLKVETSRLAEEKSRLIESTAQLTEQNKTLADQVAGLTSQVSFS